MRMMRWLWVLIFFVANATLCKGDRSTSDNLFLISTFPHDDRGQWELVGHFVRHYRDRLGLSASSFRLIIHSESGDAQGLARMARWLRRDFGITHTFPLLGVMRFVKLQEMKFQILRDHVENWNWIIMVDSDEFLSLPPTFGSVSRFVSFLDTQQKQAVYGVVVDRVHHSGALDGPVGPQTLLDTEYPLHCCLTLAITAGDVRRVPIFRGSLRTEPGNHEILGLVLEASIRMHQQNPNSSRILRDNIRSRLGENMWKLLPMPYFARFPIVNMYPQVLTLHHFKFLGGVEQKLQRKTYTLDGCCGTYASMVDIIKAGGLSQLEVNQLCINRGRGGQVGQGQRKFAELSAKELYWLYVEHDGTLPNITQDKAMRELQRSLRNIPRSFQYHARDLKMLHDAWENNRSAADAVNVSKLTHSMGGLCVKGLFCI